MHRIEHATKATNKHGTGKHGYTGGVIPATPATRPQAGEFDSFQEEISQLVEIGLGAPLTTAALDRFTQALYAVRAISHRALLANLLSEFEEVAVDSASTIQFQTVISYQHRSGTRAGKVTVVAAGAGGGIHASDDDGDTWDAATTGPSGVMRALAVGGGYFCAVGDSDNVSIAEVTDAAGSWAAKTVPSADYKDVAYISGIDEFIVVGTNGKAARGKLGGTWTDVSVTGWSNIVARVAVHGSTIVAGGSTEGLARSDDDGATWTDVEALTGAGGVVGLYWADGCWWALTAVNGLYRSKDDGLTWTLSAAVSTTFWSSNDAASNRALVVVGGLFITYQSEESVAAAGVRIFTQELGATVPVVNMPWRTAGDPLETGKALHFDPYLGQFWLVTGADDKVYRSKKAPGAFDRFLELPHYETA